MKFKRLFSTYILVALSAFMIPKSVAATKTDDFVLVIDAGHGGKDIGATDNNVKEKDINLSVAKNLSSQIKKSLKNVKVVMTRDDDTFISLQERANIANKNKGNLFISIHTNSVDKTNPNRKTVSGASVYALGLHKDESNLKVAQRENSVIELESNYEQKYSGFDPSKDESYIIFEMAQKKNLGQSLKFANLAQKQLTSVAERANRGVKQAGFWVLWATSMPAVLVELDFICNPTSAVFMSSDSGSKKLAEALFNAVKSYVTSYSQTADASEKQKENIEPLIEDMESHSMKNSFSVASTSISKKERTDTPPSIAKAKKSSGTTPRKRRSLASKKVSDNRTVETEMIPLKSENDYLHIEEKEEVLVAKVEETPTKTNSKGKNKKNNKKSKETKVAKVTTEESKTQKSSTKKTGRTSGNTKFVVNQSGDILKETTATGGKTVISSTSHRSKVEKLTTVYKIQVLTSEDELHQNNPQFHGLTPIKSFREDNLYKYTYGESKNKSEIEELLKEVKKVIPDAFIISNKK